MKLPRSNRYAFDPSRYEPELRGLIGEIARHDTLDPAGLSELLRRYPKDGRGFFSKSEIIRGFRHLNAATSLAVDERTFLDKIRMKPIRTLSGVAPVTVLTKPYPCPGQCIFCPSDVRMPKSYLSDEPGAQRAAQHQFDPYLQTMSRLLSYHHTGHRCDKVELIVLGGTWSSYPEEYQVWFIKRCFEISRLGHQVINNIEYRFGIRVAKRFNDGGNMYMINATKHGRNFIILKTATAKCNRLIQ